MGNAISGCLRSDPYKAPAEAPPVKHLDVVAGKVPVKDGKAAIDSTQVKSDLILNVLDHENGPAKGLPYEVHYLGPPAPPCEDARCATVRALDKMACDKPAEDPEIASILRLTANMFQAPVALVALFDSKRVYVSGSEGDVIPCGDFPWRWTLCAWSLAYNNAQILVIPDTLQDARFRENAKVTGYPGVRFYCGAPLVASNGHRLGTLCFADVSPRPGFDAASCSVMNNLSELVVRHLEKDIALRLKTRDNDVLKATYGQLQRTLDCFEHCVVLLDTSVPGWKLLHTNAAWAKLTGVERTAAVGQPLSDVFEGMDGIRLPSSELEAAAGKCFDFQVTSARLRLASPLGTPKGGFVLTFRPASREGMDESVVPIGIPAFLKPVPDGAPDASAKRFYFMSVDLAGRAISSRASSVLTAGGASCWSAGGSDVVEGLELGHLLGKGSFGSVYYGTWMGTPVGVKVLDTDVRRALSSSPSAAPEAILGQQLRHPNVVATLKWVARKVDRPNRNTSIMSSVDTEGRSKPSASENLKGPAGGTPTAASAAPNGPVSGTPNLAGAGAQEQAQQADGAAPAMGHWPVMDLADGMLHALEEEGDGVVPAASESTADWPQLQASGANSRGANKVSEGAHARGSMDMLHSSLGAHVSGTPGGGRYSEDAGGSCVQTWILMEYCDKGCLQEAIDRGWLRTERSAIAGGPCLPAVLSTAREVASAMAYLHAANVVHGDLSGWNVMLCSAGAAAGEGVRGFVAKVADFGLSRTLEIRSKMQTANYGTLSHMPPELVLHGTVSKAVDVYSFGVLLWQMYTGSRPWSGLTHSQIIMLIGSGEARLVFPPGAPPPYEALMRDCTNRDPDARPAFTDVVRRLEEMAEALGVHGTLE